MFVQTLSPPQNSLPIIAESDCAKGELIGCASTGIGPATIATRAFAVATQAVLSGHVIRYATSGVQNVLFETGITPLPTDHCYQSQTVPGRATTASGGQYIGQCWRMVSGGLYPVMLNFQTGVQS
jgi:hypothetical protein